MSLLCGFLVTFAGVYLLNLSRGDPNGVELVSGNHSSYPTRNDSIFSMEDLRQSIGEGWQRQSLGGARGGDREGLMRAYNDEDAGFELDTFAGGKSDDNATDMTMGGTGSTKPHQG